jgi:hypothetical protein
MCGIGGSRTGDYEISLSESQGDRFKKALADILAGAGEPDLKVLREMSVCLRHATRRKPPQQKG